MRTSSRTVLLTTALAGISFGCREDPTIQPANQPPVADARVIRDGKSIDEQTNGPDALKFPYAGTPVTIALDASNSHDPDGTVASYRWLSGTLAPDGGIPLPSGMGVSRRWAPPGAPPDWPEDVVAPSVDLDKGIWAFTLWVTDEDGAISRPDSVKITIGDVVDPVVQQCADRVIMTEPEACRRCVCAQSDMCRMVVTTDKCDQSCWDLMNCVATNCPDFVAMAAKMDYSCLTTNCSAFLAGVNGATPAGECFRACPNDCMPAPMNALGNGGP